MTMTARDEYPQDLDFKAVWAWREIHPNTCEDCFRQNLEVFCCPSDDFICLYCCGGTCGEHEAYDWDETEESEM